MDPTIKHSMDEITALISKSMSDGDTSRNDDLQRAIELVEEMAETANDALDSAYDAKATMNHIVAHRHDAEDLASAVCGFAEWHKHGYETSAGEQHWNDIKRQLWGVISDRVHAIVGKWPEL